MTMVEVGCAVIGLVWVVFMAYVLYPTHKTAEKLRKGEWPEDWNN